MLFSDNVSVDDEVRLKDAAAAADVLVMGPDCGTAHVGGVALGFANVVRARVGRRRRGLRHRRAAGDVPARRGRGRPQPLPRRRRPRPQGRRRGPLHPAGAAGARRRPRHRDRARRVQAAGRRRARRRRGVRRRAGPARALGGARRRAGPTSPRRSRRSSSPRGTRCRPGPPPSPPPTTPHSAAARSLRGLFCGGTLADEAMTVAEATLGGIRSNIAHAPDLALGPDLADPGHVVIDFGDDGLTRGRAHPMIDPTLRMERIAREAADPTCGVLLLDLVLGHGAHPDPAGELADAVRSARATAHADGRALPVVVSLTGTDADPQGRSRCAAVLADAGASVFLSNGAATRHALDLLRSAADDRLRAPAPARPARDRPGRRDRRGVAARRRPARPGRARHRDAVAAADGRHRDRPRPGHGRPAPRRRQRPGLRADDDRRGGARRRRAGVRGARPRARHLPARRPAAGVGAGERPDARRAHRRGALRGPRRHRRGRREAPRRRRVRPRAVPPPRARSARWPASSARRCGSTRCATTCTATTRGARSTRAWARCCATARTAPRSSSGCTG